MEEGDGMQPSNVVNPVMTMSEAEQEQAMQLAQMAQQRHVLPPSDLSLGQVHEHQRSPGLVDLAEIPNLKYCRNCGEMKLRKDYHRNHSKADELEDVCKPCKAQRDAARRRTRATVVPNVESKVCKKCAEEKRAGEFPRNKLTSDGLHSYCKRCKLAMDSASREKRKRMDSHAVRRSGPVPGEDAAQGGHARLPDGPPLQDMQHYCDACKQLCMAQEHAEGPEMPSTMRCTACGSVALPIDPAVIQALDGAIAAHMPQQDYASHDPAGLPAAAMQASAAATYHLQLNPSEAPPVATMQIQIAPAQTAEAAHANPGNLSALLSDSAQLQQSGEGKLCGACQEEKPLAHFPPSAACRDGLAPHCRGCIGRSGGGHPGYPAGSGQPGAAGLKRPGRRQRAPAHFPISEKVCRKCKANKPAADFPQKRSHPDGRDDYCKACHAKATAARVAARGPVKEPTVESKVCSKCQEQKAASEFHRDCNKPDGLRGRCRACEAAAGQARRMARVKPEAPAAAQARLCSRCHLEKPAGEFPHIKEVLRGLEALCKACSSLTTAEHQAPASTHHEAEVEMSSMYEQQAGLSAAQPLLPGSRPGPPYPPALPAPLPLAFPPMSGVAADGSQWPGSQSSEEAANAHRMALQTQQLMAQLQGMAPPGMPQRDAGQEASAGPSLDHEEQSMPMAGHASQGEPALQAEASSGISGRAAQHGDRWDSQQPQEALTQREAAEQDDRRDTEQQQDHQAIEQEHSQQGDRPSIQQLPDLSAEHEAAGVS